MAGFAPLCNGAAGSGGVGPFSASADGSGAAVATGGSMTHDGVRRLRWRARSGRSAGPSPGRSQPRHYSWRLTWRRPAPSVPRPAVRRPSLVTRAAAAAAAAGGLSCGVRGRTCSRRELPSTAQIQLPHAARPGWFRLRTLRRLCEVRRRRSHRRLRGQGRGVWGSPKSILSVSGRIFVVEFGADQS